MNWLAQFAAKVLSLIAIPILDWVYGKFEAAILRAEDLKKIADANKAIREKTEAAKTKDEKDEAARDTINRI